jgi:putative transcriptional regulator
VRILRDILVELRGKQSQECVSEKLGITQKHLSAIERGTRNPSVNLMKRFEIQYKKPMTVLFADIFLSTNTTKRS